MTECETCGRELPLPAGRGGDGLCGACPPEPKVRGQHGATLSETAMIAASIWIVIVIALLVVVVL